MAPKKTATRGLQQLKKELEEGTFRKLYLLYGSERYLIRQYRDTLIKKLVNDGDSMNFSTYRGAAVDIPTILSDAGTMPFLAERRVVLVEDSGFFTKSVDELTDALDSLPDTAVLIFVEPDIEKRDGFAKGVDKRGRLFKAFDKAESAFCFDAPDESTLTAWISSKLMETGKPVEKAVPTSLLNAVGTDMQTISSELEKLIGYTMEKDAIRVSDVEKISLSVVEDKVFDMIDAISLKNTETALYLYNDLLSLREPPMKILYLVARQYQILLSVSQMKKDNTPRESMWKLGGFKPFLVNKYLKMTEAYTKKQLLAANEACLDADGAIKSGALSDQNALERLILELLAL